MTSDEAAAELRRAITEVRSLLGRVEDDSWAMVCSAEGWTVGLVFCHVSIGLRRQGGWAERALRGRSPHSFDWERTHSLNKLVARRVQPDRSAVVASLDRGERRWERVFALARDGDLDRPAFRMGDSERGIGWVASRLAPRHIDEHLRSIRLTLSIPES